MFRNCSDNQVSKLKLFHLYGYKPKKKRSAKKKNCDDVVENVLIGSATVEIRNGRRYSSLALRGIKYARLKTVNYDSIMLSQCALTSINIDTMIKGEGTGYITVFTVETAYRWRQSII